MCGCSCYYHGKMSNSTLLILSLDICNLCLEALNNVGFLAKWMILLIYNADTQAVGGNAFFLL